MEEPFRTDVGYFEDRAAGIATARGVGEEEARTDLARRHGHASWGELVARLEALRNGAEPATPFMRAYRALESRDVAALTDLLDEHPDLVHVRGTNGNDLFGMAASIELVRLLLERGADPDRANDYGWTKLHQAGYSNDRALAELLIGAGTRSSDKSARGDGGTPLIAALFWGHREVVDLLGRAPGNLRVAAGLGDTAMIEALADTPEAGAHRGFYRPHGGFPAWQPADDPQEILDEALVWAAKADRVHALEPLVERGADPNADPYRGTPLSWAAANGRVEAIRELVRLGADPNRRGTFGGPTHGEGVTAIHLAAQAGRAPAVEALLEVGADPRLRDGLHDGDAAGWAQHAGHAELAARLRDAIPD